MIFVVALLVLLGRAFIRPMVWRANTRGRTTKWPIYCIIERDNRDEQGTPMELTKKYMEHFR